MHVYSEEKGDDLLRNAVGHITDCVVCQSQLDEQYGPQWRCLLTGMLAMNYVSPKEIWPETRRWVDTHTGEQRGCWCYADIMRLKFSVVRVVRYDVLDQWMERFDVLRKSLKEPKSTEEEESTSD